jgi:hypothetical protein
MLDNTTPITIFPGNDSAESFEFPFKAWKTSEVTVQHLSGADTPVVTTLDEGVDYDITLNSDTGGTISFPKSGSGWSTLANGETLVASLEMVMEQDIQLPNNRAFLSAVVEDALDKTTARVKQLAALMEYAVIAQPGSGVDPDNLITELSNAAAATLVARAAAEAAQTGAISAKDAALIAQAAAEAAAATLDLPVPAAGDMLFGSDSEAGKFVTISWTALGGTIIDTFNLLRTDTADTINALIADGKQTHAGADTSALVVTHNHIKWALTTSSALGVDFTLPDGWEGALVFHVYPDGNDLTYSASFEVDPRIADIDPTASQVRIGVEVFDDVYTIVSLQNMGA